MWTAVLIIGGTVLLVTMVVLRRVVRDRRRARLMNEPLALDQKAVLEQNLPLYAHLPKRLQAQLGGLIQIFLVEKEFVGCGGQEITDEIRVTVAAQACILLLNRETRYYPRLHTIYVYPATYVARPPGGHDRDGQARLGESWQNGPVVLAWNSVLGGATNIQDGQNVVFHEFATVSIRKTDLPTAPRFWRIEVATPPGPRS